MNWHTDMYRNSGVKMLNILNTTALIVGYIVMLVIVIIAVLTIVIISLPTTNDGITTRFAWLPTKVKTWRNSTTTAIVWLQTYYVKTGTGMYIPLNGETPLNTKYVLRLGYLSYEF